MKRILSVLLIVLAACDGGTTSPTEPLLSRRAVAVSPAAIINCQGIGLIVSLNVQAGTCATDVNGGTGSVVFGAGFLRVTLTAKSSHGAPELVASSWQSNGPVSATSQVCVAISVTHLSLHRDGEVQVQLRLSYNGAPQPPLTWSVTSTGHKQFCGTVPAGATNVWWQLIGVVGVPTPTPTTGSGHRHPGGAKASLELLGVSVT